jgi:hypothetical protein
MKVIIGEPQDDGQVDTDIEIHPWDTWALDLTLAHIIVPCLEQLRDGSQSYPEEFEEFEEWTGVIDKMIVAFENVIGDETSDIGYWSDERWRDTKDGFSLFGKHYTDLWM